MKRIFQISIFLFLFSCQKKSPSLPYYNSADFTPNWSLQEDVNFHKIRAFNLIDQKGVKFTEKNIEGKICVVDFFFTSCPGICPNMAVSMRKIQNEFLDDENLLLLSHSVTPETDSVSVLQAYAIRKGVNYNRWKLLTGERKEIYDLGRKYYFVEENEGFKRSLDVFLHTENFVLIDKNRHIRGIYNGLDPDSMSELVEDIKILEKE